MPDTDPRGILNHMSQSADRSPVHPGPWVPSPEGAGVAARDQDGPRRRGPARPVVGAEYHQLLRTGRHHWWRPILSMVLVVVLGFAALIAFMLGGMLVARLAGASDAYATLSGWMEGTTTTVAGTLALDVLLALLLLVALGAIRLGHGVPLGTLHSVQGRVRWGWLARCLALLFPLWILYLGIGLLVDPPETSGPDPMWVGLVVLSLVATPFQAAGEEYLFRGWLLQSVGSWFRNRYVALAVPTVLSLALFGAAHGSTDPWILADLGLTTLAAVVLTWRTGGLEAAVALHVVNNVLVGIAGAVTGLTQASYIDESTTGDPLGTLVSLVAHVLAVVLILRAARRHGIASRAAEPFAVPS